MTAPLVLHAIDSLRLGGAESLLATIVEQLRATGTARSWVCVASDEGADSGLVRRIEAAAERLEVLDAPSLADPRFPAALARGARRSRVDVLHAHLSGSNVASRIAARAVGRPQVTTLHTPPGPHVEGSRRRALADGLTARLSARIVAPARRVAEAYARAYRVPRSRFLVIPTVPVARPPGPGFDRARKRRELGLDGERAVLAVARLQREKGIADLLDASRLLRELVPSARVLVAGGGPEAEPLAAQLEELGLGAHVALLGHRADVGELLAAVDAFCLPSWHEGAPLSLLEAMAAGRACVATAVGGVPEMVDGGELGVLVPARAPRALAAALARVLSDERLARALGSRAREVVGRRNSPRAVALRHAALYRGLAAQVRPAGAGSTTRRSHSSSASRVQS